MLLLVKKGIEMWINFNDRLPDKKTPVLAWCPEHGSMFIVELYQAGDEQNESLRNPLSLDMG